MRGDISNEAFGIIILLIFVALALFVYGLVAGGGSNVIESLFPADKSEYNRYVKNLCSFPENGGYSEALYETNEISSTDEAVALENVAKDVAKCDYYSRNYFTMPDGHRFDRTKDMDFAAVDSCPRTDDPDKVVVSYLCPPEGCGLKRPEKYRISVRPVLAEFAAGTDLCVMMERAT